MPDRIYNKFFESLFELYIMLFLRLVILVEIVAQGILRSVAQLWQTRILSLAYLSYTSSSDWIFSIIIINFFCAFSLHDTYGSESATGKVGPEAKCRTRATWWTHWRFICRTLFLKMMINHEWLKTSGNTNLWWTSYNRKLGCLWSLCSWRTKLRNVMVQKSPIITEKESLRYYTLERITMGGV